PVRGSKQERCKRYLGYLPYAKVKVTKGAWLVCAIRDGFGPPAAYEQAQAKREREEEAMRRSREERVRQVSNEASRCEKMLRLRERYDQLERFNGRALQAFSEHLASERARAERFVKHTLSESGRKKFFDAFDSPERRLEIFGEWLERAGTQEWDDAQSNAGLGVKGKGLSPFWGRIEAEAA